ncbi:phosphopentomutase [Streptomyces albidus (ex Kaewkla and Franco 2022)]|uniref:phosphopentomutase n=1 Tax=Streptomyces albidus (ex Kaewkla and Franco 2022) TaxID=722709 RepID=UPI0015EF03D9|nr:phosphopentomutase [Streptomyces albidus (ex Kaewkla and Franco 2022)]
MNRCVIVVVDGLGIGAMPDAGELRPGDRAADTLGHVLDRCRASRSRPLRLPAFGALGLGVLHPHPDLTGRTALPVALCRARLGYPGADTYAGHQTMMGADFSKVTVARLGERLAEVTDALEQAGHTVELLDGEPLPVVDGRVLVHDNLEADPGINWNASGRLEELPFERILAVARTVRAVAPVARVIAVGGHSEHPLSASVRNGDGGTVGLDTPATGFYRNGGLQVQHLGAPMDHTRQLPELAARAGVAVTLTGKAADILACESALRRPAVVTDEVLEHTLSAVRNARSTEQGALVVANVQETDLAGHQQDAPRFGAVLEQTDAGLAALLEELDRPGDRLIVTGDHGNDPTIGHANHTREYVPVLIHRPDGERVARLPDAEGLADVGATAARFLGLDPGGLAGGSPLLPH